MNNDINIYFCVAEDASELVFETGEPNGSIIRLRAWLDRFGKLQTIGDMD